ncbi:uncharacterized protein LOC125178494 [Hyalella azteca]|uniref:Uncharacterized protein LOC125178494 n=1 Tax=Hyalella azteca TaxID=294128 RepID=A0A979FQ63_HYAAZ|nr:uncharacterized protein LOC125178494 [Hyalella azteca]
MKIKSVLHPNSGTGTQLEVSSNVASIPVDSTSQLSTFSPQLNSSVIANLTRNKEPIIEPPHEHEINRGANVDVDNVIIDVEGHDANEHFALSDTREASEVSKTSLNCDQNSCSSAGKGENKCVIEGATAISTGLSPGDTSLSGPFPSSHSRKMMAPNVDNGIKIESLTPADSSNLHRDLDEKLPIILPITNTDATPLTSVNVGSPSEETVPTAIDSSLQINENSSKFLPRNSVNISEEEISSGASNEKSLPRNSVKICEKEKSSAAVGEKSLPINSVKISEKDNLFEAVTAVVEQNMTVSEAAMKFAVSRSLLLSAVKEQSLSQLIQAGQAFKSHIEKFAHIMQDPVNEEQENVKTKGQDMSKSPVNIGPDAEDAATCMDRNELCDLVLLGTRMYFDFEADAGGTTAATGAKGTTPAAIARGTTAAADARGTTAAAGSRDTTVAAGARGTTAAAGSRDTTVAAGARGTTAAAGSRDTTVSAGARGMKANDASGKSFTINNVHDRRKILKDSAPTKHSVSNDVLARHTTPHVQPARGTTCRDATRTLKSRVKKDTARSIKSRIVSKKFVQERNLSKKNVHNKMKNPMENVSGNPRGVKQMIAGASGMKLDSQEAISLKSSKSAKRTTKETVGIGTQLHSLSKHVSCSSTNTVIPVTNKIRAASRKMHGRGTRTIDRRVGDKEGSRGTQRGGGTITINSRVEVKECATGLLPESENLNVGFESSFELEKSMMESTEGYVSLNKESSDEAIAVENNGFSKCVGLTKEPVGWMCRGDSSDS